MKHIITLIALLLIVGVANSQEKEKRIKFNKGTLKICSSSNMKISGYDGDEVIIKSLNESRFSYYYDLSERDENLLDSLADSIDSKSEKSYYILSGQYEDKALEKGLKPLGNKSANPEDNLYLDITEKPGELILRDYSQNNYNSGQGKLTVTSSSLYFNNQYEILIPNTIKLLWNIEDCTKKNSNTFFVTSGSDPWELSNFKGEVEVSTSYNSINFVDVSGPVIANTIGGNIKVVFDKVSPTNLYSLISNDGYIDVTLPQSANINVDAIGNRILSDIDFKVLNETLVNGTKGMELQLNSGKTKIKLDAGSGSVYLRKQK